MSEGKWSETIPTIEGWYWVKWKEGERAAGDTGMFYFDASDYDIHQLSTRAELFYGPLTAPSFEDSR